jgi:pimeloyl-ACP methyl ester carboxylesterase
MWYSQVPTLSRAFRVITFDNRDTGNSDRVAEPYTISEVLKKWIPQARLIIYEGLGHLFLMEDPNTANADVQRFIQASSANHP